MSHSPADSTDDFVPQPRPKDRELSGRAIVIGMFVLGLLLTALLFVYWEYNTRPFRPLREAIGREFRHSRPIVEGGRLKGRGPMVLRISMSVPFDPFQDDAKSKEVQTRVLTLARQHHDLTEFDKVQVNLIHFVPEQEARTKSFEWSGTDAAKRDVIE